MINLSGGIDSTYLLWKYLNQGKKILVHTCKLVNLEGRSAPEYAAAMNIFNFLNKKYPDQMQLIRTSFDNVDMRSIIRDIEIVYFISAMILRNKKYKNITEIAVSANAHDESNNPNEKSVVRRREILSSILPRKEFEGYDSSAKLSFPMLDKTKKQIIEEMPKNLFEMTWFCRKPVAFDSEGTMLGKNDPKAKFWKACKTCSPCRYVIDALS